MKNRLACISLFFGWTNLSSEGSGGLDTSPSWLLPAALSFPALGRPDLGGGSRTKITASASALYFVVKRRSGPFLNFKRKVKLVPGNSTGT